MKKPRYADIANLPEDDRITIIGTEAMAGNIIGVALEKDPDKIARYIEKITTRFPDIMHMSTEPGLVPDMVIVKVGPRT